MIIPLCKICKERHWGLCPSNVSDGGGGSKPTSTGVEVRRHSGRPSQPVERIPAGVFRASQVGVATDPSEASSGVAKAARTANPRPSLSTVSPEAKKTRAPNGTFDRNVYQREYMRERRAKLK